MSYLELKNVSKKFGQTTIIPDVSMGIEEGEFIVFVGPSGCGKSTLLRMISGLESMSGGDIILDGKVLNDAEPANRGVAMVFQSYALYPHMTVRENMGFSLRVNHIPRKERNRRVEEAARILQLEELLDRKPSQLSGGQKQRVAIGRAIVREPKIFLFDEPLSNLDAELRVAMRAEILQLHASLKNTMIYVTHDQVEAMTLADRIVVLKQGEVQQFGKPLDLYDDPNNLFVAGFIGTPKMNFLSAKVVAATPDSAKVVMFDNAKQITISTPVNLTGHGTITIGVRPDKLTVAKSDKAMLPLPVTFGYAEELGETTYIHAHLPDGQKLIALQHGARLKEEAVEQLNFDPTEAYFFDENGQRIRNG